VALRWARALARFEDPEVPQVIETDVGPTDAVNLVPFLETDPFDPESLVTRWRQGRTQAAASLTTPVGVTAEGVFRVDLVADGPHCLVVGTTGSGKSELLRTLVAGLATAVSPDHVNFLIIDSRGSRALDQCARLPHAVGLIPNLSQHLGEQALRILEAEANRREQLLRTVNATDLDDYHSLALDPRRELDPLPRLLIVIDDFEVAAENGKFVSDLADLAYRGSAVGIHLLLATQRLSGAVLTFTASITANLRLALRTQTEADSIDMIASEVAAAIAPDRPGRGFALVSASKLIAFQAAQVHGVTATPHVSVEVHPFRFRAETSRAGDAAGDGAEEDTTSGFADFVTAVDAAFAASGLTRPRQLWAGDAPAEVPLETVGLPGLLGIDDVGTIEPSTCWHPGTTPSLKVPVGLTLARAPLHLDLKESALGGMGPHGLVVGATGSGKSEFLRTLVAALAITHGPDQLSFVLVDFKGGAAFASLAALPHVAGMITNLEGDLSLVDRMYDALFGEQRRRQELLRTAGALASVHDYQKRRATDADMEPLPSLLIIVDEFAELLTAKPDFIDLFVSIGRLGRSLGMHLLLSSQRLEEGRLRGLESHIRYRIGLRTFSAQDSRAVLGVQDAYELPSEPGVGYLKVDTTTFTRFKGALISVPYAPPNGREPVDAERSVLDVVVSRLSDAPRVHQVWLPPLEPVTTLDQLLPGLTVDPQRGFTATGWHGVGRLVAPIGMVDRPAEQRRGVVEIDAGGASGNLVIAGAPQTGKTTLLRTLVTAFALTHTPAEAQFYCIDYGGGGLAALEGLPHVGSVASRLEPDKVRRLIAEVDGIMASREELFQKHGIDSVASMRALRQAGSLSGQQIADVFLVIDNWPALRRTFEDLEEVVLDVAARGLGYGIHVVVTVNRWLDLRGNLRDSLGGILELRLTETGESLVDRKIASNVPVGAPGRGLLREKLHFQTAVPRIDTKISTRDLGVGIEDLVTRVASSWSGPTAPAVRLLPTTVDAGQLPGPGTDHGRGVPVGVVETDLSPWYLNLTGSEPHFLVFGDAESGKTTFLRTFITGLCARHSHQEVRVAIIDYRRTLLETVEPDYLGFYAGAAPAATDAVAALRAALIKRLPGSDVSAAQLRARSWWQGPEYYLVVDDYDLVATAANPLSGVLEFIAQGRDLGFHLLLARRVAGAQRALFEPVLQQVKELGNPGLILSGDRGEGPLLGTSRATAFPPGRGLLVRRKEQPVRVQVAWTPEFEKATDSTPTNQ
jgi:S-DNA-T family DNA segregation ATPase FtsK/SpoIIIE